MTRTREDWMRTAHIVNILICVTMSPSWTWCWLSLNESGFCQCCTHISLAGCAFTVVANFADNTFCHAEFRAIVLRGTRFTYALAYIRLNETRRAWTWHDSSSDTEVSHRALITLSCISWRFICGTFQANVALITVTVVIA